MIAEIICIDDFKRIVFNNNNGSSRWIFTEAQNLSQLQLFMVDQLPKVFSKLSFSMYKLFYSFLTLLNCYIQCMVAKERTNKNSNFNKCIITYFQNICIIFNAIISSCVKRTYLVWIHHHWFMLYIYSWYTSGCHWQCWLVCIQGWKWHWWWGVGGLAIMKFKSMWSHWGVKPNCLVGETCHFYRSRLTGVGYFECRYSW